MVDLVLVEQYSQEFRLDSFFSVGLLKELWNWYGVLLNLGRKVVNFKVEQPTIYRKI